MTSFHWTEEKDNSLTQVVKNMKPRRKSKKSQEKGSKWERIAAEFNAVTGSTATGDVLRNRWNRLENAEKQTEMLVTSSGMGTQLSKMDTAVLKEFLETHPLVSTKLAEKKLKKNQDDEEWCESDLSQNDSEISQTAMELLGKNVEAENFEKIKPMTDKTEDKTTEDKKKIVKPHSQPLPLTQFEKAVLAIFDKELEHEKIKTYEYSACVAILNEMNLEDQDYYAALDILMENGNATKFLSIPLERRKQFLLMKIKK